MIYTKNRNLKLLKSAKKGILKYVNQLTQFWKYKKRMPKSRYRDRHHSNPYIDFCILLSGFCQLSEALQLTPFTATPFLMQRWQVRLRGIGSVNRN